MRDGFFTSVKRWIFWTFPRGSIQYDVMVALILAFIFLTPRSVFRDQPKPNQIVMLPGEGGGAVFWIEPALLAGVAEDSRAAQVTELVRKQAHGRRFAVSRVEPIFDSEQEIKGYMAFAKPGN